MWFNIIKTIIFSILIIFIIHHLIIYLRDTYTVKKTNDVVGYHVQKYKTIMDELQRSNQQLTQQLSNIQPIMEPNNKTYHLSDYDRQIMDQDLDQFVQTFA